MKNLGTVTKGQQMRALTLSTLAFTVCFAVWTIFSIIGVRIKSQLGLSETEFGILIATPILTGSLSRIFLGIWTDKYGGRKVFSLVMATTAVAVWLLSSVESYAMFLVAALGVGLAGGSFAVGIAYVSRWFPQQTQGTALGIFGMGNVGAAVTNFGAPFILVAIGWQGVAQFYAVVLLVTAVLFWLTTREDPVTAARQSAQESPESTALALAPLRRLQVWRFSLYYFFVFGAFVALALWLPRYYVGVYGLDIKTAGLLAALYAMPGSIFRALGGWMSDKFGARRVMYWTFAASALALFFMSYPATEYKVAGINGPIVFSFEIGLVAFVSLTVVLGFFMSLGKAAVYKHIPVYYPDHVGSVGGLVGMIGGLGGFILPIAFGALNDLTGVWTSSYMLLFAIVAVSFLWMHAAIQRMEKTRLQAEAGDRYFPEMGDPGAARRARAAEADAVNHTTGATPSAIAPEKIS